MDLDCPSCHRKLDCTEELPLSCPHCGFAPIGRAPDRIGGVGTGISTDETANLPPGGTPPTPPAIDTPGEVGGYRLIRPLGKGGMGRVYEAEDRSTGRRVAVKLLDPKLANAPGGLERFRQEGCLASRISHPRSVFAFEADTDAGYPYIVMELMPGPNLDDLIRSEGPLGPEDAVGKILDVIEGLQEAHRLGVIHRDVKPSNCFLDQDGHVKVGDFGLSKSLVSDVDLTRSGSFLGTPAFAAPEQIRGDAVDFRADVYSTAATLYFLLTGKPPHQGHDAMAVVARIVSEPPTPLRSLRTDVPAALERVVLRGLERDRDARWHDLEDFRRALLPFAPAHLSLATVALRTAAYFVDVALFAPLGLLASGEGSPLAIMLGLTELSALQKTAFVLGRAAPWILYFAVLEGVWGCSLGKRLLGLRVLRPATGVPPGVTRACVRALGFYLLVSLPADAIESFAPMFTEGALDLESFLWLGGFFGSPLLGVLLIASSMRERNSYRGLHDYLARTRVVQLHATEKPLAPADRQDMLDPLDRLALVANGLPPRIGDFRIRGALAEWPGAGLLLGEDVGLGRRVLIDVRAAPLDPARRDLNRATRLRWLAAGQHGKRYWEAFIAPAGQPLTALAASTGAMTWRAARPILEQLAEELTAAIDDGSLPATLSIEQVWVQPQGRVQLLDWPLTCRDAEQPAVGEAHDTQALLLLYDTALTTLTGQPAAPDDPRRRRFLDSLKADAGASGSPESESSSQAAHDGGRGRLPPEDTVCPRCWAGFRARARLPFWACFREFTCPRCGKKFTWTSRRHGLETAIIGSFGLVLVAANIALWIGLRRPRPSLVIFATLAIGVYVNSFRIARRRKRTLRHPLLPRVPLHVAEILDGLPGGEEPVRTSRAFRDLLAASRRRPVEVTTGLRAGQLALLGTFLMPGLLVYMSAVLFSGIKATALSSHIETAMVLAEKIEDDRLEELLTSESTLYVYEMLDPETGSRWVQAREVLAICRSGEFRARLAESIERDVAEMRTRLTMSSATIKLFDLETHARARHIVNGEFSPDAGGFTLDDAVAAINRARAAPGYPRITDLLTVDAPEYWVSLAVLVTTAFWVVWAFLLRGGLSYRLVGIAIVGADGLPASRFRCAWRTIIVWGPIMTLLLAALWTEALHPDRDLVVMILRFSAIALAIACVALALRRPHGSLHDRLVGTFLVPR